MSSQGWWHDAVFYEVPVYAFSDSNGDGIGDFPGLTDRLDYLEWLGIDCIWILPFFESPQQDGGYDVSDFRAVFPKYGTLEDVKHFVDEVHRRGMRVITDFVVNHTSDQHPWFQEARKPNSPTRDRYVWTDDPSLWSDARVIFTDTHDSNWTWDESASAYYWHRFFDHQPDLNYDNPDVRSEMEDAIRFWLQMGFDGLRLDAVPYLFERDGTNGENLKETHEYLKTLRQMVDSEFPGSILLAEANQWPEDVVEYFGDGDECHMAFHFPVMSRLFMSLKKGSAESLIDILTHTPPIPDVAQWGIFLRNHDELTLEMVSDDERQFMYEQYAPDPAMRKNVGIRRRLAPLLDGDERKIRLLHSLILSLTGSPILYYGDEIGMGDIYFLEDRDGVRTPMQWNESEGVGFTDGNPGSLYLPVVNTPGYSPAEVNVSRQMGDPDSLLEWVRTMLAIRGENPIFGVGSFDAVDSGKQEVFAFERADGAGRVLVLANLSDGAVTAQIPVLKSGSSLIDGQHISGPAVDLEAYGFDWIKVDQPGDGEGPVGS